MKPEIVTKEQKKAVTEDIVLACLGLAVDKSAAKPVCLDLQHLEAFTDYFLIATISNAKQGRAIADALEDFLKKKFHIRCFGVTGVEQGNWILIDFGFFFVHLFQEETREMFSLETLWNKAEFIELPEEDLRYRYHQMNQSE